MTSLALIAALACAETDPETDAPSGSEPAAESSAAESSAAESSAAESSAAESSAAESSASPASRAAEGPQLASLTTALGGCPADGDGVLCAGPQGYALRKGGQPLAETLALLDPTGAVLHELSCGERQLFGQVAEWRTAGEQPFALIVRCTHGQVGDAGFRPDGEQVLVRGLRGFEDLVHDVDARAVATPDQEARRLADAAQGG